MMTRKGALILAAALLLLTASSVGAEWVYDGPSVFGNVRMDHMYFNEEDFPAYPGEYEWDGMATSFGFKPETGYGWLVDRDLYLSVWQGDTELFSKVLTYRGTATFGYHTWSNRFSELGDYDGKPLSEYDMSYWGDKSYRFFYLDDNGGRQYLTRPWDGQDWIWTTPADRLKKLAIPTVDYEPGCTGLTITWDPVEGAEYYRIGLGWVGPTGNPGPMFYSSAPVFITGERGVWTYKEDEPLPEEDLVIWFQPRIGPDPDGALDWPLEFQVSKSTHVFKVPYRPHPILPPPPIVLSPVGMIEQQKPVLSWSEVPCATGYTVRIEGLGERFLTPAACLDGTCSLTCPVSLAWGQTYEMKVKTRNDDGDGDWSDPVSFTVGSVVLDAPAPITPAGTIDTNRPVFSWQPVMGATKYQIHVEGMGDKTVSAAVCSGGVCSYKSPVAFAWERNFEWKVRGMNDAGQGDWSEVLAFFTGQVTTEAPVLIGPSGSITSHRPVFSWQEVSGALQYLVRVEGLGERWVSSSACTSGVCSFPCPAWLPGGTTYQWKALAKKYEVNGPWSGTMSFTVVP